MKTDNNKTAKEAVKNVLEVLLEINFGTISSLHKTMLVEVLINNKTFAELTETVKLTTGRQKVVFQNAVNSLINSLKKVNEKLNSYDQLKEELLITQEHFKILERKINREESISPKLKKILSIPIGRAGFSMRVQHICSFSGIHFISDLVSISKREFLKLRNCGKRSTDEVDEFFKRNELSWNMPIGKK